MRTRRPTPEQHRQGLRLYRANATPDRIAELTGMAPEQVDWAIASGWPARRGKTPSPELLAYDAVLEDRAVRIRLARLDWAQVVAESAAPGAKERAETAKIAAKIERLILNAWAALCDDAMKKAQAKNERPTPIQLSVPLETVRSLRALRLAQDPHPEKKIADLFHSIRGDGDGGDGETEDEWEIIRDLAACSFEEQEAYVRDGTRPSRPQQVLQFDRKSG